MHYYLFCIFHLFIYIVDFNCIPKVEGLFEGVVKGVPHICYYISTQRLSDGATAAKVSTRKAPTVFFEALRKLGCFEGHEKHQRYERHEKCNT